jgi:hypothetical protein
MSAMNTSAELDAAKNLLDNYRNGQEPAGTTEEQIWRAKVLYDSAFHPQTGEKNFFIGRMSCQVIKKGWVLIVSRPFSDANRNRRNLVHCFVCVCVCANVFHTHVVYIVCKCVCVRVCLCLCTHMWRWWMQQVPANMLITVAMLTYYKNNTVLPFLMLSWLCVEHLMRLLPRSPHTPSCTLYYFSTRALQISDTIFFWNVFSFILNVLNIL